jgi:competence protein ComEC
MLRSFFYFSQSTDLKNGQKLDFKSRLTQEPQIVNGRQQFTIKTHENARIRIITGMNPRLKYGDNLHISGIIKTSEKNGHTFFTMLFPKVQIATNDQNILLQFAGYFRQRAGRLYKESLPPVSSSLLMGIVFGGDQNMPKKFLEELRISGTVHVIAASGMNVTFVAGALMSILGAILCRQIALTIAILGIAFYTLLAGLEPSIVRAAIMSIIAFSASLLGRQNFAINSVFLTGFLMLIFSPMLIYDIGFQLSFLATLGILSIKPILDSIFKKGGVIGKLLGDDIGTTVSAQITTLPILLAVFGQYGLFSILVNTLVLWTVPILMVIGSIGLLVGLIFEPFGKIILIFSIPILFYFEKLISYFGNLGFVLVIPELPRVVWVGYYFLLLALVLYHHKKLARSNQQKSV